MDGTRLNCVSPRDWKAECVHVHVHVHTELFGERCRIKLKKANGYTLVLHWMDGSLQLSIRSMGTHTHTRTHPHTHTHNYTSSGLNTLCQ